MKACRAGLLAFAMGLALAGCAARQNAPAAVYGSPPAVATGPLPLRRALSDANRGRTISVKGRVGEVCRTKGCWMVLTDGERFVRITFRDYAFFVPKDLAGKTAVAEGTLSRRLRTADEAEHLGAESGAPPPSGVGPVEEWSLVATSVIVPATRQAPGRKARPYPRRIGK